MSSSRRYSLRFTIATLVVALLLVTVAGVLVIAFLIRERTIDETAVALQEEISTRITERVVERFSPLAGVLRELRVSSSISGAIGDDAALTEHLAHRLRFEQRVEWIAFIRPDGTGVGAVTKPDGIQVIRKSTPDGDVSAELWRRDGTREPDDPVDLSNLQQVEWFQMAAEDDGPIWTPPYQRAYDGAIGRATALAYRENGDLIGVFGLGFSAGFIRTYIQSIEVGETGGVFGIHPLTGEIMMSPSDEAEARMGPAVAAAVASLPKGITGLTVGGLETTAVEHDGVGYRIGLSLQHPEGLQRWVHAIVVPESELVGYFGGYLVIGLTAVGVLLTISILLAQMLARRVAGSLREIASDLERVGDFDLRERRSTGSLIREVAVVGEATERMKASLRSFGRYVPKDLVRDLLSEGEEARLGGTDRPLTLFFSDVEGFTGLSESMTPGAVVEALGAYLDVLTETVKAQGGTIDKFIGDGVVAFFNAPRDDDDHAVHACRASLELQRRLGEEIPKWEADGGPPMWTRVGLHTDEVVVGNIGTPERFAYTVIGDGVNFAARLESLNKAYGTWILASDAVVAATGDVFVWRRLDRTAVAGRTAGSDVFELLGEADDVDASVLEARDVYERALDCYFERDFSRAAAEFAEAARLRPNDRAATVLEARARVYAERPPPDDWTGVYVQTTK